MTKKKKNNVKQIEKVFRKDMQKEMMWFFGIHVAHSQRAELSFDW